MIKIGSFVCLVQVSHMFGDAFSPYMIGALADSFKPLISPSSNVTSDTDSLANISFLPSSGKASVSSELTPEEYDVEFRALEYSLFTCCFFQVYSIYDIKIVEFIIFDRLLGHSSSLLYLGTL